MECLVQFLNCGYNATGNSTLLTFQKTIKTETKTVNQILVNVGDSCQRICQDNRIKLHAISAILITSLAPHNLSGFAGIFLALSDLGVGELQVFGPSGLKAYLDAILPYINRRYPELKVEEVDGVRSVRTKGAVLRLEPVYNADEPRRTVALAASATVVDDLSFRFDDERAPLPRLCFLPAAHYFATFPSLRELLQAASAGPADDGDGDGAAREAAPRPVVVFCPIAVASHFGEDRRADDDSDADDASPLSASEAAPTAAAGDAAARSDADDASTASDADGDDVVSPAKSAFSDLRQLSRRHASLSFVLPNVLDGETRAEFRSLQTRLARGYAAGGDRRAPCADRPRGKKRPLPGDEPRRPLRLVAPPLAALRAALRRADASDGAAGGAALPLAGSGALCVAEPLLLLRLRSDRPAQCVAEPAPLLQRIVGAVRDARPDDDADAAADDEAPPATEPLLRLESAADEDDAAAADDDAAASDGDDRAALGAAVAAGGGCLSPRKRSLEQMRGTAPPPLPLPPSVPLAPFSPPKPPLAAPPSDASSAAAAPDGRSALNRSAASFLRAKLLTLQTLPPVAAVAAALRPEAKASPLADAAAQEAASSGSRRPPNPFASAVRSVCAAARPAADRRPPPVEAAAEALQLSAPALAEAPSAELASPAALQGLLDLSLAPPAASPPAPSSPPVASSSGGGGGGGRQRKRPNLSLDLRPPSPPPAAALDDAAAVAALGDACRVSFLGTGSAAPSTQRANSAILLTLLAAGDAAAAGAARPGEEDGPGVLLDCGEGAASQLFQLCGGSVARFDALLLSLRVVWVSHHHADHAAGLTMLLHHLRRAQMRRRRSLRVRSLRSALSRLVRSYPSQLWDKYRIRDGLSAPTVEPGRLLLVGPESVLRATEFCLSVAGLDDLVGFLPATNALYAGLTRQVQELTDGRLRRLVAVPVQHCHSAFALVLELRGGRKVVYSGDCRPSQSLVRAGRGCSLLIHEATFADCDAADAQKKRHCTEAEALAVARQMRVDAVVLTHFSQRYNARSDAPSQPSQPPQPPPSQPQPAESAAAAGPAALAAVASGAGGAPALDPPPRVVYAVDLLSFLFPSQFAQAMREAPSPFDAAASDAPR